MDGTPLARAEDVATWFPGVALDDPKLLEALAEASNRFRGAVRHYVSAEMADVVLDGTGSAYLSLPSINVQREGFVCTVDGSVDLVPVGVSPSGAIKRMDGGVFPDGLGNVRCAVVRRPYAAFAAI